jgi:DNA-directed RNA polymerase specialized sigma24 family protein
MEAAAESRGLLARLGTLDREVFLLADVERRTAREIGKALALNPNTVSSRLRVARRVLIRAAVPAAGFGGR